MTYQEESTLRTMGATVAARVLEGDMRAAGKLIRQLDDGIESAQAALTILLGSPSHALVVGVTGPPGAGKSTILDKLVEVYRARGEKVGVLAVDPSSPISGGALLGDRVRMQRHATDPGVFIRSFASRGQLGGLARSTFDAVFVLEAMEFGVIFVETVGVGQDEVDIASTADITLVVTTPMAGDGVQALKAGVLEVADVLAVNKADLPNADQAVAQLNTMLAMRQSGRKDVAVLPLVASDGRGMEELVKALDTERGSEAVRQKSHARRVQRIRMRLEGKVRDVLLKSANDAAGGDAGWNNAAQAVLNGQIELADVVAQVLSVVKGDPTDAIGAHDQGPIGESTFGGAFDEISHGGRTTGTSPIPAAADEPTDTIEIALDDTFDDSF